MLGMEAVARGLLQELGMCQLRTTLRHLRNLDLGFADIGIHEMSLGASAQLIEHGGSVADNHLAESDTAQGIRDHL